MAGSPDAWAAIEPDPGRPSAEPGDLPTAAIVGTATITECKRNSGYYEWQL